MNLKIIFLSWHWSGISRGLVPSIVMSQSDVEKMGGGGYGEKILGISLSKSKNIASNFTGMARYGSVHAVILKRGKSRKYAWNRRCSRA